jgi:hypothetical protein
MMKQLSQWKSARVLLSSVIATCLPGRPVNTCLCKRFVSVPVGGDIGKSVIARSFKYS